MSTVMEKRGYLKEKLPTVPDPLAPHGGIGDLKIDLITVLFPNILSEMPEGFLAQMIHAHRMAEAVVGDAGVQGLHPGLGNIM